MKYIVLCFGRTDFTRLTIESILEHAKFTPEIIIVNNGWNSNVVPKEIEDYWKQFIKQYKTDISKIYNVEKINSGFALDAFSIPELDDNDKYHFITDNDCILRPGLSRYFDETLKDAMDDLTNLNKLGVRFHRSVSLSYCRDYSGKNLTLDDYLLPSSDFFQNDRLVASTSEMDAGIRNDFKVPVTSPKLINAPSDTTLSIVRKPYRVAQEEIEGKFIRYSPTLNGTEMLHLGYLEPIFFNKKNELSNLEFIWYHQIRPFVLPRYFNDYSKRRDYYLKNLAIAGFDEPVKRIEAILKRALWGNLFQQMHVDYKKNNSTIQKILKKLFK